MSLAPGATIGVLGGGQLGRMTALAAARLGCRTAVLAPEAEAPAADVAWRHWQAGYDDSGALAEFLAVVDVVTLEWENVPVSALAAIAAQKPMRPGAEVLRITQDRLLEKSFVAGLDVPVAPFARVDDVDALMAGVDRLGPRTVLKTRRFGYDGKGQEVLGPESRPAEAFARLGGARLGGEALILEAFVPFERELSVIVARRPNGEMRCFPPVENRHQAQILVETIAPAELPGSVARSAIDIAERIAAALRLEGLLAVEMFLEPGGRLLVNELAPRPHNSGHWTIDGCTVSQFEQQVRAILDLPLGDTTPLAPCVMQNLLGDAIDAWPAILAEPGACLHLYGKREARPGRKMGHVTRFRR
jgi:5-(carboxyamino)imidazole ribonucleotide synthase